MNRRHLVLGAVFVLTLAASVFDLPWQKTDSAQEPAEMPKATVRNADGAPAASGRPDSQVPAPATAATPGAARMHHTKGNLFAAHSWLPPVVKPPPPLPPPPPRAPALPFAYLGKMQDGAAMTVFVSQGARNLVLRSGDTLPQYRVESITPTDMTFVYLPLGEKQRLTFGSEN
jgi:hypothetical protein